MDRVFTFPPPPPPPKPKRDQGDVRGEANCAGKLKGFDDQRSHGTKTSSLQRSGIYAPTRVDEIRKCSRTAKPHSQHDWNSRTTDSTNPQQPRVARNDPSLGSPQSHSVSQRSLEPSDRRVDGSHSRMAKHEPHRLRTSTNLIQLPSPPAGVKRKLDAPQSSASHLRFGSSAPPAVPSFGSQFICPSSETVANNIQDPKTVPVQAKQARNALGLTPIEDESVHSSESDDEEREVDEEAQYARVGDKITFEHNGVILKLSTREEISAWKNERRKKWPTRARMVERAADHRRIGEERKRLLQTARILEASGPDRWQRRARRNGSATPVPLTTVSEQESTTRSSGLSETPSNRKVTAKISLTEQTALLESLRQRVAESEVRNCRARTASGQCADAEETDPERALRSMNLPDMESQGYVPDVNVDSYDATDDKSISSTRDDASFLEKHPQPDPVLKSVQDVDAAAPDELTSKPMPREQKQESARACRYFAATGHCRNGDACGWPHDEPVGGIEVQSDFRRQNMDVKKAPARSGQPSSKDIPSSKQSIFGRLVDHERSEENGLALQVVKYLGTRGIFLE